MPVVVDTFVNMPVTAEQRLVERSTDVLKWFNQRAEVLIDGMGIDGLIAEMDAAAVDVALLVARSGWSHPATRPVGPLATSHGVDDDIFDQFCDEAASAVQDHPDRLRLTVMLDPMGAMRAVRQLERAVRDYGAIAARLFPATTGVPPNHPLCYPIYTKCIELGLPIAINMGLPGPRRSGRVQQPILLEDVLLAYPELTVVGSHIGHPWHLETLAMLQKFDNFYLTSAGWAPRYIPAEIVHLMNTRGGDRVMWASDFPLIDVGRAVNEAHQLPLKEDRRSAYLGTNAVDVFKLRT